MGGEIKTQKGDFMRVMVKPFAAWGWNFNEVQADMLYPMIAEYSESAMENATKHLLRESKFRPKPAEIIDACKKFSPLQNSSGAFLQELDRRDAEIQSQSVVYTESFMNRDSLADQAKQEGWEDELEEFVRLTANTMLQMISAKPDGNGKLRGYGWSSHAVPAEYVRVYEMLLKQAAIKVRESGVDVTLALPNMAPAYWRTQAFKKIPKDETPFDRDVGEMLTRIQDHFKLKPWAEAA